MMEKKLTGFGVVTKGVVVLLDVDVVDEVVVVERSKLEVEVSTGFSQPDIFGPLESHQPLERH